MVLVSGKNDDGAVAPIGRMESKLYPASQLVREIRLEHARLLVDDLLQPATCLHTL